MSNEYQDLWQGMRTHLELSSNEYLKSEYILELMAMMEKARVG